jgi:UDP-N-acetylmuramoyl-tripeptide--D-alanyl-D-alanine ligase
VSCVGVEIVGTIGGCLTRRNLQATGISIDSRTIQPGHIFFALEGKHTDGHQYVGQALDKGAIAVVVHREVEVEESFRDRVILVEDTLCTLGESARDYRRAWGGVVIGVTGSNGKTTTRDMIHHILTGSVKCKRSPRSYNTNIGVPLTLFLAEPDDEVLVVEMGTNAPGELAELCRIAEPNHGLITNIGESHLEGLGSIEGVARAKAELLEGLPQGGMAFLPAEDEWAAFLHEFTRGGVTTFGLCPCCNFRARTFRAIEDGHWFIVGDGVEVTLHVPGVHNLRNAAGALAVAHHMGVDLAVAAERLESFRLPPLRYEVESIGGVTVVCDCYNANPSSMRAALESFGNIEAKGRRIAVLGDMMELGDESASLHEQLGADVIRYGVDALWAVGSFGGSLADGARQSGLNGAAHHVKNIDKAFEELCESIVPGDALLVKGSRGMALEKLVERFRERHSALTLKET